MFAPFTSSMRFTPPRVELRARDQRSGAYPTKARTGDRTRTGRNKYYFDDTRTVIFQDNVDVSLPTTLPTGSIHTAYDLTSSFVVIGNTRPENVDQWLTHREQVETLGPFVEDKLYEQNERSILNSKFMTGAAYAIASDRFSSGLAGKTIIRITVPLTQESVLSPNSSSMYYLNPTSGKFEFIDSQRYNTFNSFGKGGNAPTMLEMFDPILFGPFGYLNCPNSYTPTNSTNRSLATPSVALSAINNFVPDGSNVFDVSAFGAASPIRTSLKTGSLIYTGHTASANQSIDLSAYLSAPFLLEKVVVEFPFAAGPGWMNDSYMMRSYVKQNNAGTAISDKRIDGGGPMITVGLMRQDGAHFHHRDLIASGTFTNAYEAYTASYELSSHSLNNQANGGQKNHLLLYTRTGLSGTIDPTFVCVGPVMSGSTNYFTGAVKLTMTPAVTQHITRVRVSGTCEVGFYGTSILTSSFGTGQEIFGGGGGGGGPTTDTGPQSSRINMASLMTFGSPSRRPGVFDSGRSVLGNNLALLPSTLIDGNVVPVKSYEPDFESLTGRKKDTNKTETGKVYWDLISSTKQSPYLLYPKDKLVLCVNKHRAVASTMSLSVSDTRPDDVIARAQHDAKILGGSMTITLYGDLVKEDREFHDTLNQRLETEELWETIGEEPVLDQFDVTYASELSGSYLDRFNIQNVVNYRDFGSTLKLPTSLATTQYYSNFTQIAPSVMSSLYRWSNNKQVYEFAKNSRGVVHTTLNELYWDTRVPDPGELIKFLNPNIVLDNYDLSYLYMVDLGGPVTNGGYGIDWQMSYPYEGKFSNLSYLFSNKLVGSIFRYQHMASQAVSAEFVNYGRITININYGDGDSPDNVACEDLFNGLGTPEFIKAFFGIGDGHSRTRNQSVTYRQSDTSGVIVTQAGAEIRGWRYGLLNGFPTRTMCVFRRDRFGQVRDMLEQRLDAKFYNENESTLAGVKEGPIQVRFYDRAGNVTDPLRTLSSNISFEATSSVPYTDGIARNRAAIDYSNLNISSVTI